MMSNSIGRIHQPGELVLKMNKKSLYNILKIFSRFEQGKPVIVMTHGWNSNWGSGSWLNDMRDVLK